MFKLIFILLTITLTKQSNINFNSIKTVNINCGSRNCTEKIFICSKLVEKCTINCSERGSCNSVAIFSSADTTEVNCNGDEACGNAIINCGHVENEQNNKCSVWCGKSGCSRAHISVIGKWKQGVHIYTSAGQSIGKTTTGKTITGKTTTKQTTRTVVKSNKYSYESLQSSYITAYTTSKVTLYCPVTSSLSLSTSSSLLSCPSTLHFLCNFKHKSNCKCIGNCKNINIIRKSKQTTKSKVNKIKSKPNLNSNTNINTNKKTKSRLLRKKIIKSNYKQTESSAAAIWKSKYQLNMKNNKKEQDKLIKSKNKSKLVKQSIMTSVSTTTDGTGSAVGSSASANPDGSLRVVSEASGIDSDAKAKSKSSAIVEGKSRATVKADSSGNVGSGATASLAPFGWVSISAAGFTISSGSGSGDKKTAQSANIVVKDKINAHVENNARGDANSFVSVSGATIKPNGEIRTLSSSNQRGQTVSSGNIKSEAKDLSSAQAQHFHIGDINGGTFATVEPVSGHVDARIHVTLTPNSLVKDQIKSEIKDGSKVEAKLVANDAGFVDINVGSRTFSAINPGVLIVTRTEPKAKTDLKAKIDIENGIKSEAEQKSKGKVETRVDGGKDIGIDVGIYKEVAAEANSKSDINIKTESNKGEAELNSKHSGAGGQTIVDAAGTNINSAGIQSAFFGGTDAKLETNIKAKSANDNINTNINVKAKHDAGIDIFLQPKVDGSNSVVGGGGSNNQNSKLNVEYHSQNQKSKIEGSVIKKGQTSSNIEGGVDASGNINAVAGIKSFTTGDQGTKFITIYTKNGAAIKIKLLTKGDASASVTGSHSNTGVFTAIPVASAGPGGFAKSKIIIKKDGEIIHTDKQIAFNGPP